MRAVRAAGMIWSSARRRSRGVGGMANDEAAAGDGADCIVLLCDVPVVSLMETAVGEGYPTK